LSYAGKKLRFLDDVGNIGAIAFKRPYEAIDAAVNCSTILSVDDLFSK